eukprot:441695_1
MSRTFIPKPDIYEWKESKAKCVLLDQPSHSLANMRSPKPLFYQPKDSTNKYLIITPYKKMDDESTYFVYKYDIKANEYIKFVRYPKKFDIDWPMHFIDYNNDILFIFDSNRKPQNGTKLFWKLNLIDRTWTNVQIKIQSMPNHENIFKPKGQWASPSYTDNNTTVNIVYRDRHRNINKYVINTFNFENEEFKTKTIDHIYHNEWFFPNGKYWESLKLKDIPRYNAMSRERILLKFGHILFLILWDPNYQVIQSTQKGPLLLRENSSAPTFDAQIWCLNLLDDGVNKWYKSAKQLPSYIQQNPNQYYIATTDGYLHFYHQYFYHTIISLIDVVPKEIKVNLGVKYKILTFGYIKSKIE